MAFLLRELGSLLAALLVHFTGKCGHVTTMKCHPQIPVCRLSFAFPLASQEIFRKRVVFILYAFEAANEPLGQSLNVQ